MPRPSSGLKTIIRRYAGLLGLAAVVTAAAPVAQTARAATTVDPPAGSPQFMRLPFSDTAVRMIMGWYYDADSPATSLSCAYGGGDVPGWKQHCGIDFRKSVSNTNVTFKVVAASGGRALLQNNVPNAGTVVSIEHDTVAPSGEKFCTRYLHLDRSRPLLPLGQWTPVTEGQPIGWAGRSGTTKIHLHFDVKVGGCGGNAPRVDPLDIAGRLIPADTPPVKGYYPGFANFTSCGPDRLFRRCISHW